MPILGKVLTGVLFSNWILTSLLCSYILQPSVCDDWPFYCLLHLLHMMEFIKFDILHVRYHLLGEIGDCMKNRNMYVIDFSICGQLAHQYVVAYYCVCFLLVWGLFQLFLSHLFIWGLTVLCSKYVSFIVWFDFGLT